MRGREAGRRVAAACALALAGWAGLGVRAAGSAGIDAEFPFPVGERLVYRIYWGVVPVGESVASTEWVEEGGRRLIAIRFRTRTNKFMERIYPVDDLIETLIYPETLLPARFTKRLSEGRYRCHEVTVFDHSGRQARWRSETSGRSKTYPIEADTRDIVSFMYFARTMDFHPGESRQFRVMADEKLYDVFVRVTGKEEVRLGDGTTCPSLVLEPEAAFEGLFVRKGRMWLWISEDKPRVVTRLAARVPVASVKLLLEHRPPPTASPQAAEARAR